MHVTNIIIITIIVNKFMIYTGDNFYDDRQIYI